MAGKTISVTVENDLCVSCGICKAVCPVDCISMDFAGGQFLPIIDMGACIDCGKCYDVCPGIAVDYESIYEQKDWKYPENIFAGNNGESYVTYLKDDDIRKKSSSGGLVSGMLINLIESGEYEKAFVVECSVSDGEEVKATPASNKEEILAGAKSEYLPVSMENVINQLQKNPDEKIVVVGTSCHLHGIHKFMKEENIPGDNILFLGLFCEKTLNLNIIDYYRNNYCKKDEKIKEFNYRDKGDNGWPGNSKVVFDSGREEFIDRKVRMWLKEYFQINRCIFCIDKLNQFADISFGDCYIKGEESYLGKSNIIVRSEKGIEAFNRVKGEIEYKPVDFDRIYESQKISNKKINLIYDRVLEFDRINLLKDEIELEYDKVRYKDRLKAKQRKLEFGRYYSENKEEINRQVNRKKLKSIMRLPKRVIIKVLRVLGIKETIKRLLRGGK